MKCPNCQFENRDGAKFCKDCGNKLELICPECGHTTALGSKFCDECGQRLAEALETKRTKPEPESERKHITALFSDMSGYTAMTERLDPEDVKEIMSRVFGEIAQVVTKYGGFIEKFIGDAVLVLFGVPKVHEDDPVRAIKAAREIHDVVKALSPKLESKIGGPLSMHSGINTGLVVTGEVNLENGTHGIAGDTINMASRLQGLAKPGEILVGPQTYRLVAPYFEMHALDATNIKGKARRIIPYRVVKELAVHSRFEAAEQRGFTAFTGRERELETLYSCFEKTVAGDGQFVTIVGEAGVGKSRLTKACEDAKILYGRDVKGGFVFHDLRHTCKTNLRKAGVSQSVRMKIQGHSTAEMDNRYDAVDSEDKLQAIDQLEGYLQNVDHCIDQNQEDEKGKPQETSKQRALER